MTVAELIKELLAVPNKTIKVMAYELECDDYVDIAKVEYADNGNQLNLVTQYTLDHDAA